ncbi:hypothetical protein SBRY_10266 [Actinacidiphila bryophytorum]|uniref:Uncharacterized protein n=1 Tax=Actinacidiphila bryophytorum TaxID=1436133 RepID=A0A9W4E2L3_9ACTN|nr:hypothetical protein SBRY_10266 [Actinacidiphila bryophytorum]
MAPCHWLYQSYHHRYTTTAPHANAPEAMVCLRGVAQRQQRRQRRAVRRVPAATSAC